MSLDAKTGAVRALVGGYDYHSKTFNRATQAMRQPGSTFKPFVYSAALAKGMTASTMINDAPISLPGKGANGKAWNPKKFRRPLFRLHHAAPGFDRFEKHGIHPHPDVYRYRLRATIHPTLRLQAV